LNPLRLLVIVGSAYLAYELFSLARALPCILCDERALFQSIWTWLAMV
jgi:hypothetical protein